MYAALWYLLPGPAWLRATILTVAAIAVVVLLFLVVFPLVGHVLNSQDVTVG